MSNPYNLSLPGNHYAGNVELRKEIVERVARGGESFAVVGGPRCGKTSTIRVIGKELGALKVNGHVFLPIEIGPGTFDTWSPNAIFRRVFESLVSGLPKPVSDTIDTRNPYESFNAGLAGVSAKLVDHYGPHWMAIVLIDQIDGIKDQLPRNTRLFANLRDLLSTGDWSAHFRLIVTGTNELGGLRNLGSPLRNVLAKRELGIIDRKAVDELAAAGFKGGLGRETKEMLATLSGCHPYLVQGLLLELWYLSRKEAAPVSDNEISPLHVEEAAVRFKEGYSDVFSVWTESIGSLACDVFGEVLVNGGDISTQELSTRLSATPKEIDIAIGRLATHGVVDSWSGDRAIPTGTLFAEWFEGTISKPRVEEALAALEARLDDVETDPAVRTKIVEAIADIRDTLEQGAQTSGAPKSPGGRLRTVVDALSTIANLSSSVATVWSVASKFPYLG